MGSEGPVSHPAAGTLERVSMLQQDSPALPMERMNAIYLPKAIISGSIPKFDTGSIPKSEPEIQK